MSPSGCVLVTGCAGFIGFHLAKRLLKEGSSVVGLDNLNPYYDVSLKEKRLEILQEYSGFAFVRASLEEKDAVERVFREHPIKKVLHMAAQAGVRYSLENPYVYIEANVAGFLNLLECCRRREVEHFVFASSSSVYGANTKKPFSVSDNVDHPVSLYAATKKTGELMAHVYSSLYGLPVTGLRFFTVYGPWGRPDMALFKFTRAILEDKPIQVYNYGRMKRDFTYIDDVVEGVVRVLELLPRGNPEWSGDSPDPGSSFAPYRLYNIGNNRPVELLHFIEVLEETLGKKARKEFLPLQPGDVVETYADVEDLMREAGFKPATPIEVGIPKFVEWYREYYGV